ncbi:MAG: cyclase [Flavobacteriales bacterium]|jgi:cyclase
MRLIYRVEIKNNYIVKGLQYEGVRKIKLIDDFVLPLNIDVEELFVVDLTRSVFSLPPNYAALENLASKTLLPITFGGGISTLEQALLAFKLGASRVYLNSAIHNNSSLIANITNIVGKQAVVAGCEYRVEGGQRNCYIESGREPIQQTVNFRADNLVEMGAGEILLSNIDSDGMLTGFDVDVLSDTSLDVPITLASGGNNLLKESYSAIKGCEAVSFSKSLLSIL